MFHTAPPPPPPQKHNFLLAHSQLEVARYALKPHDLVLHTGFLRQLRALPSEYSYGEYRQIFEDYGTHYIAEATLGGEYEYSVMLNKENMEKSGEMVRWNDHEILSLLRQNGMFVQNLTFTCKEEKNMKLLSFYDWEYLQNNK